jgi:hypothetical protein
MLWQQRNAAACILQEVINRVAAKQHGMQQQLSMNNH